MPGTHELLFGPVQDADAPRLPPSPMRPRELTILLLCACLGTAAGVALLSRETYAETLPPQPVQPVEVEPAAAELPAIPATLPADDGAIVVTEASARGGRATVDTTGWTHGILRGDIELAVNAIDRIESLSVHVEELRGGLRSDGSYQAPFRRSIPVSFDRTRTPTFEIRDVPFSDYPYAVTVYTPGLNGSRRTVQLDAEHPIVEDIVLAISVGAPFSLLLRDQDGNPYPQLDVRLVPVGEPAGRPRLDAISDGYGCAIYESALAGDYAVHVFQNGQPLGEPQTVTVQPGGRLYQTRVQGQGQVVTIPRGQPLEVFVVDGNGYGIPDARVQLQATDKVRLTQLDLTTDAGGIARFPYLTPGVWQIDVTKDGCQPRFRQITVQDRTPIPRQELNLVRLR